ncbi:MAG TPA: cytochrome c [Methylomirabilota bacterium]|nr:cytochrome c [Methylomirabilota bacterium]
MIRFATLAGLAAAVALMLVTTAAVGPLGAQGTKWELTKQQKERAEKAKNPVAADKRAASAENGKKMAAQNCAPCHGPSGKGDGPGAAVLPKKPADWTSKAVQEEKDGSIFVKITDGNPPMPPWGSLPEKDRWDLVNYIKSLGKKS